MRRRRQVELPNGESRRLPELGFSLGSLVQTKAAGQIEVNTQTKERTSLIGIWAEKAASQAYFERTDDLPGYHAYVEGARGAWGLGATQDEAREDLEKVLVEWAKLMLDLGRDDIPAIGGMDLCSNR